MRRLIPSVDLRGLRDLRLRYTIPPVDPKLILNFELIYIVAKSLHHCSLELEKGPNGTEMSQQEVRTTSYMHD